MATANSDETGSCLGARRVAQWRWMRMLPGSVIAVSCGTGRNPFAATVFKNVPTQSADGYDCIDDTSNREEVIAGSVDGIVAAAAGDVRRYPVDNECRPRSVS